MFSRFLSRKRNSRVMRYAEACSQIVTWNVFMPVTSGLHHGLPIGYLVFISLNDRGLLLRAARFHIFLIMARLFQCQSLVIFAVIYLYRMSLYITDVYTSRNNFH